MNGFSRYNQTNWMIADSDIHEPLKYLLKETKADYFLLRLGKETIKASIDANNELQLFNMSPASESVLKAAMELCENIRELYK